jgi:putative peptidoglycan lipid II flippase
MSSVRFRSILLVLLSGNVLITAANLLRDVAIASAFGAGREADILFLAISIPLFLITVSANAFRSVTVPALGTALAAGIETCRAVSRRFLLVSSTGSLTAALLLAMGAALVYWLPVPGIDPSDRQRFTLVLAAIVPMYWFAAQLELWQGPFQAWGRYMTPSLLRLGLPCGIAIGALLLHRFSVFGVAIGGGAGALLGLIGGLLLLWRIDILPRPGTLPLPPETRKTVFTNYTALVTATCITYANPMVDQWLAGLTGDGGISMLGYASRLTTGVAGLVAGSLSQALLVHYSRLVGNNDQAGIQDTWRRLLRVSPWLGCFATLGVWLTSDLGVALLYQRGSFTAATSERVATLIDLYALQFPIYWASVASFTLIWATSMNRVFLRIGIVLFVVNALCDLLFIRLFGLAGLAVTTSVVYGLSAVLLTLALMKSGVISLNSRDILALLVPFVVLAACRVPIQLLDLRLAPGESLATISASLLMLVGFGGTGAAVAWKVLGSSLLTGPPLTAQGPRPPAHPSPRDSGN